MPAAVMPALRPGMEGPDHPKRYYMEKLRGVKKKRKKKSRSQSRGRDGQRGQRGGIKKVTIVEIRRMDAPERVQQLIKVTQC